MSTAAYRPPCLNEADLKILVLRAFSNAPGDINETYHARYGHLERGITADDVIHGLEGSWVFARTPEFNPAEWQWKYRILTETVDGDSLTVIIAVDTANHSFEVITRWTPKS